ncbi:hypothetical protein ACFFMN_15765 [Planobispora siamensis]|uniref:Uncharacterized protein n=1 Tax=Planobispora siamensis TaxID=936338 RepID=A0A8J3SKE8_9ACTN|nr:hypothetical protein [Planobispora siamensis]GIH93924.1 hypothetical protein Psi01_45540 [Planobispora siamensis]
MTTLTANDYWLYKWIDEYEIHDPERVANLFQYPGPVARLVEIAKEAPTHPSDRQMPEAAIMAGRGIDLSGTMGCLDFTCKQEDIEFNYPKILTYFNHIVVEGYKADSFLNRINKIKKKDRGGLIHTLSDQVRLLLYMRDIGLDRHIVFDRKSIRAHICANCRAKHEGNTLDFIIEKVYDRETIDYIKARLRDEASITSYWIPHKWWFTVTHSFFSEPTRVMIAGPKSRRPRREDVINRVFEECSYGLLSDYDSSEHFKIPLAKSLTASWLDKKQEVADEVAVALDLSLPSIEGIPLSDLIKLREDEEPYFENFRRALREAIRSQIDKRGSAAPKDIARAVESEYIIPALADIERRLRVSRRALATKTGASVALGSTITSVGLIGSIPLIIATGVAAAATSLTHIYKYYDDLGPVQLSDMYFLWNVKRRTSKHL